MRRAQRLLALACAAVFVGSIAGAWLQPRPELTASDAREFTTMALEYVGLLDVKVAADVAPSIHAGDDSSGYPVWITASDVEGGSVVMEVDQSAAQAVGVNDVADGGGQLLSNAQTEALDDYTHDPALVRRLRRNFLATGAGLLGAVVALTVAASYAVATRTRI